MSALSEMAQAQLAPRSRARLDRLLARHHKVVTLKDFRFRPDGDASGPLQDAFDSLRGGGVIFLPKDVYGLDASPALRNSNVAVFGAGAELLDPGHRTPLTLHNVTDVTVSDLVIRGTQGARNRTNAIAIDGSCERILIDAVEFVTPSSSCAVLTGFGRSRDITIQHCQATGHYEQFVDNVGVSVEGMKLLYNVARTSAANPNPKVSRPYFFGIEPQHDCEVNDLLLLGNRADYSGVPVPDRNNCQAVCINKASLPTGSFRLGRARFVDNTFIGFGYGVRILDGRYGRTSGGMDVQLSGNVYEGIRGSAVYIRGGERDEHRDAVSIVDETIRGFSEASTHRYPAIYLDQHLYRPVVRGVRAGRRRSGTGGANGSAGVYVASRDVVGARLGPNCISDVLRRYDDRSGSAVVADGDCVAAVALRDDDHVVSLDDCSIVRLTSGEGTAEKRRFALSDGRNPGHQITLVWDAVGGGELIAAGNTHLSAAWRPTGDDTLSLVWNGDQWTEIGRSGLG